MTQVQIYTTECDTPQLLCLVLCNLAHIHLLAAAIVNNKKAPNKPHARNMQRTMGRNQAKYSLERDDPNKIHWIPL